MTTWNTTDHYYSGQGVVLIAERDAATGKPLGFLPVGNVSALAIAVATSVTEHKESQTGARGTDLRLTTETKVTANITFENFDSVNLGRALRADVTTFAAGTDSKETISAIPGYVVALKRLGLTAIAIKDKAATPVTLIPYVDDATKWDYKVNQDSGSVLFNKGATAQHATLVTGTTALDVEATYSFGAQKALAAMTQSAKDYFLRFEGLNTAEGNKPVVVEITKFSSDPLAELALISDAVGQMAVSGSALFDATRTEGSKYFTVKQLY